MKFELYYGAYKSSRTDENLSHSRPFFADIVSDSKSAQIRGEIRALLQVKETPIGAYNLQIAVIVLANNLTLVTHNTREFERVTDLRLADWQAT